MRKKSTFLEIFGLSNALIVIACWLAWEFNLPNYIGELASLVWRFVYTILFIAASVVLVKTIVSDGDKHLETVMASLCFLLWASLFVYNILSPEYQEKFHFLGYFER